MMATQKINQRGGMDASDNWGQSGGYEMPKMQQTRQKQGEIGNFGHQKGELPKLLRIIFS